MLKPHFAELRPLLFAALLVPLAGCTVHSAAPVAAADVDVSGRAVLGDEHARVEVAFSSEDRHQIHDYYYRERQSGRKELPPGLAKRDELPPGLQKQIRRNGQLPQGLQGRRLPGDLERHLSPLPANYIRLEVGHDIVLMDQRTRITVDVIKNIYPQVR